MRTATHVARPKRVHMECRGCCGYTAMRRTGSLAWCYTCWWVHVTLKDAGARTLAALSRKGGR